MPTNEVNTIRLHRVLRATPERIYRAFLDVDALAKWLPPNGFTGKVHHLDAKVGGAYKMSFTNFTTGKSHSFGGNLSRTDAPRTHLLHGQIRRSEPARRNANDDCVEAGILRNRIEHHARRGARGHTSGGLLPRLAGIADAVGATCRG
jgi:Activator of Hsp90 ATPase homolog 1-like protein